MMEKREVKFKFWNTVQQKMFEVSKITFDGYGGFEVSGCHAEESYFEDMDHLEGVLLEFTGLLDKNGKEIFEGDIVKTGTDKLMKIDWSKRQASFVIDREGWAFRHFFGEAFEADECEAVGNIYQHPELIK